MVIGKAISIQREMMIQMAAEGQVERCQITE